MPGKKSFMAGIVGAMKKTFLAVLWVSHKMGVLRGGFTQGYTRYTEPLGRCSPGTDI